VKLYGETRTPLDTHDLQLESLVSELLGAVACKPERFAVAPFWLRRMLEKLSAEFCQRLTMDELAREAGVHPVHMSRVFRRFTGKGIGEHVHRLRIREACERMVNSDASLADISCELGFADQSHFTRTFQTIAGTSPGAFRAKFSRPSIIFAVSPNRRPS
jgi:AraC family transcriptional regulator